MGYAMNSCQDTQLPRTSYRRRKVIFGIVFIIVLLVSIIALRRAGGQDAAKTASATPEAGREPILVRLGEVRELTFRDSVSADGELKSRFYAVVSPRVGGIIDDIYVREGDRVEQGVTRLFQIENEKLRQAVDHARQSLAIARSTLEEKKAVMTKAEADLAQAQKDYARNSSLYERKVIPLAEFETFETRVLQLKAELNVAAANLTLAEQNITLAGITLQMAEKDLRDSVMHAPMDGVVSNRYAEPGEMGAPGASVLRIHGTDKLKAVAYLPGEFFPRIDAAESVVSVQANGRKIGDFPIAYKAPGIDASLRTFEIWVDVPGDARYAVFGAQCVLTVVLREAQNIGVPRSALQFRDGRHWVFVPHDNVAKRIEVTPGLEENGWTELLDSPLKIGDRVIVDGQFLLDDGYPIRERHA